MIGDPVSFPKVRQLVREHFEGRFFAVRVTEPEIMEAMLTANRHGHVVCTQGGESIAGLKKAVEEGLVDKSHKLVVNSTSHQLKFSEFQKMYFEDSFPEGYGITPKGSLRNAPVSLEGGADAVARYLGLKTRG
jgi:threonine synthase